MALWLARKLVKGKSRRTPSFEYASYVDPEMFTRGERNWLCWIFMLKTILADSGFDCHWES